MDAAASVPAVIPPFVDATWLGEHRHEVVLADVRWDLDGRSGAAAFEAGHLPGAVFVDLDLWLAAPADPRHGRHPLPEPEVFARGMSAAGIGDDSTVVAYDDAGGVVAARLVWMLRATGHDAALLDGRLGPAGGGVGRGGPRPPRPAPPPPGFPPPPWPAERLAGIDDLHRDGRVLLDARDRDRFTGASEPVDPRPGHIPGARNLPAREMLDPDGRLRAPDVLRAQLEGAGARDADDVVASCGSGVTACHTLLVLEALGGPHAPLLPGSYSQWSSSDRPVETG